MCETHAPARSDTPHQVQEQPPLGRRLFGRQTKRRNSPALLVVLYASHKHGALGGPPNRPAVALPIRMTSTPQAAAAARRRSVRTASHEASKCMKPVKHRQIHAAPTSKVSCVCPHQYMHDHVRFAARICATTMATAPTKTNSYMPWASGGVRRVTILAPWGGTGN